MHKLLEQESWRQRTKFVLAALLHISSSNCLSSEKSLQHIKNAEDKLLRVTQALDSFTALSHQEV